MVNPEKRTAWTGKHKMVCVCVCACVRACVLGFAETAARGSEGGAHLSIGNERYISKICPAKIWADFPS